jgi:acetyl esterase/lipase
MEDVRKAFDLFQAQRDKSRPLIIAGFSQGGLAVVELLKHIDDETYNQLAAAYVLGYKVTKADMAACSHIRPAEDETDMGVTICYNTVKDVKYVLPIIAASDICINPVNWRTDATPVILHDTITVTVSPEYHVLVATNYSTSEYPPFRGFLNVGDIHSCEPWLYSECLQKNIAVRAKEWRKIHQLD